MVDASDMGNEPVEIVAIGYMPSEYSDKGGSYHEFSMLLGHTDLSAPTKIFDDNWSGTPVEVFSDPEVELLGVVGGEWIIFELDQSFQYNGTSNLLYELSWDGPIDPLYERIYAMSWEDDISSSVVAVYPDSSSGYLSTVVPNLLFITTQDLETVTFGSIKTSF